MHARMIWLQLCGMDACTNDCVLQTRVRVVLRTPRRYNFTYWSGGWMDGCVCVRVSLVLCYIGADIIRHWTPRDVCLPGCVRGPFGRRTSLETVVFVPGKKSPFERRILVPIYQQR